MKLLTCLIIIALFTLVAVQVAFFWGSNECQKVNGNWIKMNGGNHCVDNNLKEIDIYK